MVGAREQISQCVSYFLMCTKRRKMAFFEGCPVGWGYPPELAWWTGGRPRALIPGEGVREGLAWRTLELAWWMGGQGGGARVRGGVQGLRFRGGRW